MEFRIVHYFLISIHIAEVLHIHKIAYLDPLLQPAFDHKIFNLQQAVFARNPTLGQFSMPIDNLMAAAIFNDTNAYRKRLSTINYIILAARACRPCFVPPFGPLAPTRLAQPVTGALARVGLICYQSKANPMGLLLFATIVTRMF